MRYKQTIVGIFWVILQPFLAMMVFTFVFGTIAKISTGDIPYPVFVYSGLILWNLFARSVITASDSITSNRALVKSVYFPKITLPLAAVATNLVDFLAAFLVLLILMIYFSVKPNLVGFFILPIAIFIIMLLSSGIGSILASLNAVYRDIRFVVPYALQIALFLTPVVYPTDFVGERYRIILILNPLVGVIETARVSLLTTANIRFSPLLGSIILSWLIFFLGVYYFQKKEAKISDVI